MHINITQREGEQKRMKQIVKENRGITLILLVITITIILILGGATINMVVGEGGILRQSQETQNAQKNYVNQEDTQVNGLLSDMNEELKEDWQDPSMANKPVLGEGMIPVKWDGTSWVVTDTKDEEWFNYQEKRWANIMLTDGLVVEGISDVSTATMQEMKGKKVTSIGSMFVWIPRYAYQISSNYHNGGEGISGVINIEFMKGTTNESVTGRTTWNNSSGEGNWNIHPAFDYNGTVEGIWVAKFEASHTDCTTDVATGQTNTNDTNLTLQVKPGVTSWRNITIGNMFTVCQNYQPTFNSHMMKNSEWGAVAYLAQSSYGKNNEVWINPNSNFITGQAGTSVSAASTTTTYSYEDTVNGVNASTTGNIYGVYDMSGGAYEYVAAYVNNGHDNLTTYGGSLVSAASYMKDVYSIPETEETNIRGESYEASKEHYGDGIYETSSSFTAQASWNSEYSIFPVSDLLFFSRGASFERSSGAGTFCFDSYTGNSENNIGFRPILIVF